MKRIWKHIMFLRKQRRDLRRIIEYLDNHRQQLQELLMKHKICPDCGEKFENCEFTGEWIKGTQEQQR